ncbi:MAG: type I-E CRISPR-associated protein Cas5/CasD [Acidobacteriaceae bacterium]|nr:type I-E CRISPR-associated protein Cas5/CasD [Acidobacteriaceae bacterium]
MTKYLLFRLYGPMASWGEIAVGEARHSATYPSRSALVGLLGAALGVCREDDKAQHALTNGYRFAVKVLSTGVPLRDYHTVQSPAGVKSAAYRTRAQELTDRQSLGALLSMREYRCNSLTLVAVEALAGARWTLEELRTRLICPVFPLYLGRKSCPPALPLAAMLVMAENLHDVFKTKLHSILALSHKDEAEAEWPTPEDARVFRLYCQAPSYHWEEGMQAGMNSDMRVMRQDQPLSRRRWQFAPRREHVHLEEKSQ